MVPSDLNDSSQRESLRTMHMEDMKSTYEDEANMKYGRNRASGVDTLIKDISYQI